MPFLLNYISTIKHESVLNTLSNVQRDLQVIRVPIPFYGIQDSISQVLLKDDGSTTTKGIYPGDTIDLIGISGSGKSWIMNEISKYTVQQTPNHVIYIDLDDRYNDTNVVNDEQFHLFKQKEIIFALEDWLIEHADMYVSWIMLDGFNINLEYIQLLTTIQKKWSFCLLTTTTYTNDIIATKENSKFRDYRFIIHQQNKMQLIWPMHIDNTFSIKE